MSPRPDGYPVWLEVLVISELPTVGVSHREIAWRRGSLRPAVRRLTLPDWLDPLVLVLVIGYLLGGIAAAPFSLEEAVQTSLTSDAGIAVSHPASLVPGAAVSPIHESVRLAYGSITRYAAAIGWYAAGGRSTQTPLNLAVPDPADTRVPSTGRLLAIRLGPALLAVIAVLLIFVLARRLLGRPAALTAVLLFGLHPTIALVSRQAADAGLTLTCGLATVLVSMAISATVAHGDVPALGRWTALAALAGLTLASGPTAPPYVAGAAVFCCAGLVGRVLRQHRERLAGRKIRAPESGGPAGWLAATAFGAVLVWVLLSPALWGWLPDRLATRHDDRPTLVAERLLPDPGPHDAQAKLRAGFGVLTDSFLTPARLDTPARPDGGAGQAHYQRSGWAGLPLGTGTGPLPRPLTAVLAGLIGVVLTLAAVAGWLVLWQRSRRQAVALTGWALATAGWLVLWPSQQVGQQTPLVVIGCLLAAAAVPPVITRLRVADQLGDDGGGHPDQG